MNTEEDDKRHAAFHEAGHAVVAAHFDLEVYAHISRSARTDLVKYVAYVGQSGFYPDTTDFRASCIGWAGILAEHIAREIDVSEADLIWSVGDEVSKTDFRDINRHHQKLRTLRTASRILTRKRNELEAVARQLMIGGQAYWY